jgi:hypothetical protein
MGGGGTTLIKSGHLAGPGNFGKYFSHHALSERRSLLQLLDGAVSVPLTHEGALWVGCAIASIMLITSTEHCRWPCQFSFPYVTRAQRSNCTTPTPTGERHQTGVLRPRHSVRCKQSLCNTHTAVAAAAATAEVSTCHSA